MAHDDPTDAECGTVRVGGKEDVADVYRLGLMGLGSDAWSYEALLREVDQPHARLHVLEIPDDRVVAYVLSWLVLDEATIVQVATHPAWRRRGLARALLDRVLGDLAQEGARTCYLEVRRSRRAAIGLYRGLGFRSDGVRKGYYSGPREDALLMFRKVPGNP